MSLILNNVCKEYHSRKKHTVALQGISLLIKKGEFVCILGQSGCGKTTLLNIIAGLEHSYKGDVIVGGKRVLSPGPERMVMFQQDALFPWLNVFDNVSYGLKINKIPKEQRDKTVEYYLDMVGLLDSGYSYIHELSGGMKQRVALARALTLESEILLMDEPFAALDAKNRELLQNELIQIWERTKKTIIFITHNIEEALLLGDRTIIMEKDPGRIVKEIDIDVNRPRCMTNPALLMIKNNIQKVMSEELIHSEEEVAFA